MGDRADGGGRKIRDVAVGVVTSIHNPLQWGRVKVESHWARVIGWYAGNSRGTMFIPEVEVLLAFAGGDPNHSDVLGAVFNGQHAVPGPGNPDGRKITGGFTAGRARPREPRRPKPTNQFMNEAEIACDPERPEAERIEALEVLKRRVDPAIPAVASALLPHAQGRLAQAALDALERAAFAAPETIEPIARELDGGPVASLPGWMRLLGTLATPWSQARLWAQAVGDSHQAAAARDELARLGCNTAHIALDENEAAQLKRVTATTQALAHLDAARPASPELVSLLLDVDGFALLLKLLDAGLVVGAALERLVPFEPPNHLTKTQRSLARRLHERLRSPP
jgi:hypothetical protein